MPTIVSGGCPLHVEVEGPQNAPALMLSNSLGTTWRMWDAQAPAFAKHFRLVRYDRRGHGQSGAPKGPYSMEMFGNDAVAIMDALELKKVHWLGLSMGGMVGQWLGANRPDRIDKLILSNTGSYYENKAPWNERIAAIRANGLASIADNIMKLWFTEGFRAREPETVARLKATLIATNLDGYVGCCEAIRDMDVRPGLPTIQSPTLVIAGKHDPSTPVPNSEYIRDHIRGAKLAILDAAHIANIEQPEAYTKTVLEFLNGN